MRVLLPLPGNEAFAAALAGLHGDEIGRLETRRFPDGESYVRVLSEVAGCDVDVVCTLADPDRLFLTLAYVADALRDMGAESVGLIAPYLAYMRQDMRFHDGEAISSQSFARLLSRIFDRLTTVDPHLHRTPSLEAIYSIPCRTLHAAPLLAEWIGANIVRPLIVGPDSESEQWVSDVARRVGAPHLVLSKQRTGDFDVKVKLLSSSELSDRQPVILDDVASSGRTLIAAAEALAPAGLSRPIAVVVHALFADDAFAEVSAVFDRVVSTDSVPHATNAIALPPLFDPD